MAEITQDLQELLDASDALLEKLDNFKATHIGTPNRDAALQFSQIAQLQVVALNRNFEEAAKKGRSLSKIMQGIKGPEPKLC